jgi:plastocyanin
VRAVSRFRASGCAAALFVAGLAGCAQTPAPVSAPQEKAAGSAPDKPATAKADCTKATKVAILPKDGAYAFSPARLTIQRGAFLAVTNKSDAAHPLSSTPDAEFVTSVIDVKERQVIQFPKAGAFSVETGGAVLHLTVSGESGCGSPEPTLTITGAGKFEPSTVKVTATENFAVVNESAGSQTVSCTPGENKDHTRLEAGETQILALDEPGRYVCASVQHPAAKVTITVGDA